jgi:hypothetical protein
LEGMKALLKLRKGLAESDRIKEIDNIVDPRHWLNELERPHSCLFDVSLASEEQRCKNFLSLLVRVESCQAPFSFIDWHPDCKSVSILDRDDLIEVVPSNKKQALIQLFKLENAYSGASSNQVIQQSLLAIPSNSNSVEPISEFKSEPVPSVAVGSPPPYQENGFFTNPQLQIDGGLAQLSATLENLKSLQQRFPQHRILQAANVMIEDFKTSQSSNQNERLVAPKFK